jgi:hypothetical protein
MNIAPMSVVCHILVRDDSERSPDGHRDIRGFSRRDAPDVASLIRATRLFLAETHKIPTGL